MDEARVNAILQAIQQQSDKAMNEVVFLMAELAALKNDIDELKKQIEAQPEEKAE